MIAITRTEEPPTLRRSKAEDAWSSARGVRTALHDMQSGKCCYCEAKIPLIPVPGRRSSTIVQRRCIQEKRNVWANLLLACSRCNHEKRDAFPLDDLDEPLVIDPTSRDVDPESEITFVTQFSNEAEYRLLGRAVPMGGSPRGSATIDVVGLTADYHRQERRHHYEDVLHPWYVRWGRACDRNEEEEKRNLLAEMRRLMGGASKYAGFVRAFAREHSLPVAAPAGTTS